jgi:hypothetical protein
MLRSGFRVHRPTVGASSLRVLCARVGTTTTWDDSLLDLDVVGSPRTVRP